MACIRSDFLVLSQGTGGRAKPGIAQGPDPFLVAITLFAFCPSRRELERLCPAAPLGDPKRAGTARVSGRGREGILHPSAAPLYRHDSVPPGRPLWVGSVSSDHSRADARTGGLDSANPQSASGRSGRKAEVRSSAVAAAGDVVRLRLLLTSYRTLRELNAVTGGFSTPPPAEFDPSRTPRYPDSTSESCRWPERQTGAKSCVQVAASQDGDQGRTSVPLGLPTVRIVGEES